MTKSITLCKRCWINWNAFGNKRSFNLQQLDTRAGLSQCWDGGAHLLFCNPKSRPLHSEGVNWLCGKGERTRGFEPRQPQPALYHFTDQIWTQIVCMGSNCVTTTPPRMWSWYLKHHQLKHYIMASSHIWVNNYPSYDLPFRSPNYFSLIIHDWFE